MKINIKHILTSLLISSCGINFVMADNIDNQVKEFPAQTLHISVEDGYYHNFYPVKGNDTALDHYCLNNQCDTNYNILRLPTTFISYTFKAENIASSDVRNWVLEKAKEKSKAPGKVFKPDKLNFAFLVNLQFKSEDGRELIECPNILLSQGSFTKSDKTTYNWYLYSNIYNQAAVHTTNDTYGTIIKCNINGGEPQQFTVDAAFDRYDTLYIQRR